MPLLARHFAGLMASWLFLVMAAQVVSAGLARAEESGGAGTDEPHLELFSGAIVARSSLLGWTGTVKSLSGRGLYSSGWRLRLVAGGGRYEFISGGRKNSAMPGFLEITPGYQLRKGPLFSKIYAGFYGEYHHLARPDTGNGMAGAHYGFKLVGENWLDLPWRSHFKLDGSISTIRHEYQLDVRMGCAALMEKFAIGPELAIVGDEYDYQMRLGGFVSWQMENGQMEFSGGISRERDRKDSPWLGISWLRRF